MKMLLSPGFWRGNVVERRTTNPRNDRRTGWIRAVRLVSISRRSAGDASDAEWRSMRKIGGVPPTPGSYSARSNYDSRHLIIRRNRPCYFGTCCPSVSLPEKSSPSRVNWTTYIFRSAGIFPRSHAHAKGHANADVKASERRTALA